MTPIKRLPTSIIEQGITVDAVNSCNPSVGKVQLMPDEEPVTLLKCDEGYNVMISFGEFLKNDDKTRYIISEKDARIGKARYELNFQEEILEKRIQTRVKALQNVLIEKGEELTAKIKYIGQEAGIIEKGALVQILHNHSRSKEQSLMLKTAALAAWDDSFLDIYKRLNEAMDEEDYDFLSYYFDQQHIATFKLNIGCEMDVLKNLFSPTKLNETLKDIKIKGHLYLKAKIQIEKEIKSNI